MSKKTSRRHQKLYKMKGCSKKTRKNYLGGSADAPLAYTRQYNYSQPNPFLAYTGKGGSSVDMINKPNMNLNTNARIPGYPNTGPLPNSNTIYNSSLPQHGGSCSSCNAPLMRGGGCGCGSSSFLSKGGRKRKGGCGSLCALGFMVGGTRHREECKCSDCKKIRISKNMKGGNQGIPYPNGLVGTPWTPSVGGWPGVNGIPGNSNYISPNQMKADPVTSINNVGANPPFTVGGRRRKQKGGTLSNFVGQDLINLGRQFQFGLGSAYNALAGYSAPVNPLPWKDQFPVGAPMHPVKPIV